MASYYDKSRPRLANGQVCWLGTKTALPVLVVSPDLGDLPDDGRWQVDMMVTHQGVGRWTGQGGLQIGEVFRLMLAWREDPEVALRSWFGREPPGSVVEGVADAGLEELGL